jgi:sugar phosphate permease
MSMLLAFRFLQGGMGSTGSSVVGGTLSDLWTTSERGPKMSLLSLVCFLGNSTSSPYCHVRVLTLRSKVSRPSPCHGSKPSRPSNGAGSNGSK